VTDLQPQWQVFDGLGTWLCLVQLDGQIAHVNAAFEEAIGRTKRALLGVPLHDMFDEADRGRLLHVLHDAGRREFAVLRYDAVLRMGHGDGMPVHVIAMPIDEQGLIVIEMLPIEKQAHQDRTERLMDQARANKELIRNLAHEIKNPLGGIRGAAQLLEMELAEPAHAEYTQVIIQEADRLQTLVDRLLAPHRQPHVVADLNIHEVCERVGMLMLAEFPKGLRLVRDYDTSIPDFRGDKEQLIQVVLNIAHNAAQALCLQMQAGQAMLTFRTRVIRQVAIGKHVHKLALKLHVIDNGPGIPEHIKDRIFCPLVSGREGGSGLGLTLAQTFVQQHDGLIECESKPGHTDFQIVIPLH
jgi:two-component system, NtrC family, nitrogen regulation sensor histidine kinase GlnL